MSDQEEKDQEPRSFGRFTVSGILGRGGMGVVYLAEDPVIGRRVAIKVLRPDPALAEEERTELRSRFEQEFRSAGTLAHPNVVIIYDVGREDDGAFIAMECIEGDSLSDLINSGRVLSFREIADLAMQLCGALDYAHEAGIVHRDIKPANILMTPEGRPKITDFGVAKVVSANLTRTGTVIGTPTYMSPEQVTGQPITGASDQWSIAVILYQMLTGELPFLGESPTTILYKIVHQDPLGPHTLNRGLPEAVDHVLLRALKKNPQDRYPTCTAMAEELQAALGAAPLIPAESTARTVTLSQSDIEVGSGTYGGAASWWQRQKPAPRIGMIIGAALLVAGLGWVVASNLGNGEQERTVAALPDPPPVEPSTPRPEAAAVSHSLAVLSDVGEGAEIWIDGEDSGARTPGTIELSGAPGDPVRLELRRYTQVVAETELVLGSDLEPEWKPIERTLPSETYQVVSRPEGATVSVNGAPVEGTTPLVIELVPGERYRVVVTKPGFSERPWSFRFPDLPAASLESRTLAFNLEANVPTGRLVARSTAYPVMIEVAGQEAGPSFAPQLELQPGTYEVTLNAPSVLFTSTRKVEIRSGQEEEISGLPAVREVRIVTIPPNAEVYVDGQLAGESPFNQLLTLGPHDFRADYADGSTATSRERIGPRSESVVIAADR